MADNQNEEQDALAELRKLLFSSEIEKIEALHQRVEVAENFSERVGEILPQAMIKSAQSSDRLAQALIPTVEEIVALSIKRDINKFADVLFPVIGPAIRKSISEAFRQMIQSLNRAIEQSFTWQGVKWRMESARSGVPVAQLAMLHGLVYRVEQAFLIHRETGLLLHHVEQDGMESQNADMVSSMLSAIKDFVGDSFDVEDNQGLGRVEAGEFSIWIEQGPDSILAIVIRGEAPNNLRTIQQQTLEKIQQDYNDDLVNFNGDVTSFGAADSLLRDCMQAQYKVEKKKASRVPILILIVLLILFSFWTGYSYYQSMLQDEYISILKNESGYVITEVTEDDGVLRINGMRDPLSRKPVDIYRASVLADKPVVHRFSFYQSLEAEFTNRRVVERVFKILQPPQTVTLQYKDGVLVVSGRADSAWREILKSRTPLINGIDSYDSSKLKFQFEPYLLAPPEGVRMDVEDGVVYISGAAEQEWILSLPSAIKPFAEIDAIDYRALVNLTEQKLVGNIAELESEVVLFDAATAASVNLSNKTKISRLANSIVDLSKRLSRNIVINVKGYSDSVGSFEDNVALSLERAEYVAKTLYDANVAPKYIKVSGLEVLVEKESSAAEKRYNRRVNFEVQVE